MFSILRFFALMATMLAVSHASSIRGGEDRDLQTTTTCTLADAQTLCPTSFGCQNKPDKVSICKKNGNKKKTTLCINATSVCDHIKLGNTCGPCA
jgi:hypothetical protein